MNDRSFWVTNTVGNVPSGAGTTNSAINIITFPSDQSFGIGYFLLAAIINPNTNGFTGAIINGTYTNNVMLQTGTKRIGG